MAKKKNINTTDDADFNMSDRDRRRTILGVALAATTLYLTFAFISYLFTWRIDQSTLDVQVIKLLNSNITASNWAGTIGALLAQRFLYKWVGLPAFGLIVILTVIVLHLFKIKAWPIGRTIKLTLVYAIWGSIALGYVFHYAAFTPGGAHGYFVSEWLNAVIGKLGTGIVLITCLFVILSFTFDSFIARCRDFVKDLFRPKVADIELPAASDAEIQGEESSDIPTDTDREQQSDLDSADNENDAENQEDEDDSEMPFVNNDKDLLKFEIKTTATFDNSDNDDDLSNNLGVVESELIEDDNNDNSNDNSNLIGGQGNFVIATPTQNNDEIKPGENADNKPNDDVEIEVIQNEEEKKDIIDTKIEEEGPYDPTRDLENYRLPSIELLNDYEQNNTDVTEEELIANKDKIVETLNDYKIQIAKINATVGPTVTLYEIVPAKGVKISKIKNLSDDIALSLAALGIRIIAPIPGRGTIGIEVPNTKPQTVAMRTVLASKNSRNRTTNCQWPSERPSPTKRSPSI